MSKKREHHKLFMVGSDAPFQFTEAYKSLRTNLEFLAATSDCKTILITSSVPGEGKSNVAVNLAITLADSGKRVVLVDCDMRKSTISRYLHIPYPTGQCTGQLQRPGHCGATCWHHPPESIGIVGNEGDGEYL